VHWRKEVCRVLELPFERLTSPAQVHGGEVVPVTASDAGCGRDGRGSAVKYVDGLVTNDPGVPLILLTADCPLVCAYDPVRRAVGAVHSSWQGTVAHATAQMIRVMQQAFGSDPGDLLAAIAPSAGPCCYEVGEDVRRIARTRLPDADVFFSLFRFAVQGRGGGDEPKHRPSRLTFDLWSANKQQLLDAGLRAANIELAGLCTICNPRFWSHRRDGVAAGRSALFLGLRS
jgi:YfiH family protein